MKIGFSLNCLIFNAKSVSFFIVCGHPSRTSDLLNCAFGAASRGWPGVVNFGHPLCLKFGSVTYQSLIFLEIAKTNIFILFRSTFIVLADPSTKIVASSNDLISFEYPKISLNVGSA